ncbi:class I SAM-dependent methyltransferase [Sporomusa sp.]|uniref:class I SAM-dependent methyltransferase n=1 Tax=Sporomusa sp. TaxID=2078658 RepID=UPI002CDA5060|nr:class I SAM-dependent methyltransferase [Sporomusa sp.]HWR44299.1 class I SAM-dependent methyltransferase [Sporomusa sp.]
MKDNYYCWGRAEVLDLVPNTPQNVLELGCGEGIFGYLIKEKYGSFVTGIELCPEAAKKAENRLDIVHNTTIENFDFTTDGKYDLIVANDLLEHLTDPWSLVNKLRDNLNDDGYFLASIPNIRHHKIFTELFIQGNWQYVESGLLDRTHLRFFTKKTMIDLFQNNNYVVNSVHPINIDRIKNKHFLKKILKVWLPDLYTLQFVIIAQKLK